MAPPAKAKAETKENVAGNAPPEFQTKTNDHPKEQNKWEQTM